MKLKFCILIILFFTIAVFSQQKKPFTIETLYKVKTVGAPVLSEDTRLIAFTVTESILKEGRTETDIYIMHTDGSGLRKLTDDKKSKSSLFWFGNETIFFVSEGQLYKINIFNRKVDKLTDYHAGISSPQISPDALWIAFIADLYTECGADNECNKHLYKGSAEGPIQAYVSDELMFRHWTDYSEGRIPNLVVYDLNNKVYKSIASSEWLSDNFKLSGGNKFDISPDGKEICFVKNEEKNLASSTNADIFIVPSDSGEAVNISLNNKALDASPDYSPDGKYIAFKSQSVPGFEADKYNISVYDRSTKKITILTESFDNQVEDFCWSENSEDIYFTASVEGYSPMYKVSVNSKKIEPYTGKRSIFGFDLTKDNKLVFNQRTIEKPAELFITDSGDKNPMQLTNFNKELLEEYDFRPAEQFWVNGADGKRMHVFMVKPHGFDESKKYPVILNVHGGPQSQWMDSFRGDWQVYPGSGYIVVFPNPHGSVGYGHEYTNAISGDWGGKTYEDLMLLMDEVEKMPFVDKDRIGAMGWSYGGYMMNWFQAKTKRFKCLASMMGIFDIESMWGATEELWFVNWDLKGQPWNSELYEKFSPSNYVENFSTPTLIITGEKDYRVPYTQSLQYFSTLQTLGIDSRIIVFENDGHWPGSVTSMPLYYNAHLEWFHKYLGGGAAPYDSKKMVTNTAFE